jgi:hypothetical protein
MNHAARPISLTIIPTTLKNKLLNPVVEARKFY